MATRSRDVGGCPSLGGWLEVVIPRSAVGQPHCHAYSSWLIIVCCVARVLCHLMIFQYVFCPLPVIVIREHLVGL